MIELTLDEVERTISDLENKHPDFKALYMDQETCSCCKVDYDLWDPQKIRDWRLYESRRFLRGD